MYYLGIDVAKDKHDCCILTSEGKQVVDTFTITNSLEGFTTLLKRIHACTKVTDEFRVGLEATGHYSRNILRFLLDNGLHTFLINPLHTNLFRRSSSLRKTKTDKIDAWIIASMLMSGVKLESYTGSLYHNEELKSLVRYRFSKVRERARLKQSLRRLITIVFPELEKLVSSIHQVSIYEMLFEYPGAIHISKANLTRLTHILEQASKGQYKRDKAVAIREAARQSVGSTSYAHSLELRHAINLIREMSKELEEIEDSIQAIVDQMDLPMLTIPGIGKHTGAMILAEVGDFSRFSSPDQLLAFAGLSPSVHESGKLKGTGGKSRMDKRGSRYLRYALFTAAGSVYRYSSQFKAYYKKKHAEGKHHFVVISHIAKKLVRLIFALQKSGKAYQPAA